MMGLPPWLLDFINNSVYAMLLADALWALYCVLVVWTRLSGKSFRSDKQQDAFLDELEQPLLKGDVEAATAVCETSSKALPQLCRLGLANAQFELTKVQDLLMERFQQDVLTDIENKINWINNVIKTAPMLGLLGTVLGMMSAFAKLAGASGKAVDPQALASDISFALITTACGLFITIPCLLAIAKLGIMLRNFESMITVGLNRFLDALAIAQRQMPAQRR